MRRQFFHLFKLCSALLLFTCGLLMISDKQWKEQQNNVNVGRPLETGGGENSNVSIIRQMFGPPRSKPTAVLIADRVGNFEPQFYPNNKSGPGENGMAVHLPSDKAEDGRKSAQEYGQVEEVSKLIAMDRSVPDSRPQECKYWHYDTDLPMASVIIIYHNEGFHTLVRTVHSIKNTSPERYLKEIILVDDFSDKEDLKGKLDDHLEEHFGSLVRLHRTTKREGLMRARTIGAKLATAEAVVFLDAHCECNRNWLVPLLARIAFDPTIMAAPIPDGIDQDTFAYKSYYNNENQASFDWGLGQKEVKAPEEYLKRRANSSEPFWSPAIVGYAMALNREFFLSIGAFDPGLEVWGGEQYELSFKVWQCGGSVELVPCSHVAHIWRRKLPYDFGNIGATITSSIAIARNYVRVVEVWMDPEYREYFYIKHPDMRGYPAGDLTEQFELKKRLQCKSFKYFLDNFASGVLKWNPPLPTNVAWGEVAWKDGTNDICWENKEDRIVVLAKCNRWRRSQLFRFNAEGQLAIENNCVVRADDVDLRLEECPTQPTGDFQYEPVTHLIRHIPTDTCAEGEDTDKEVRLRACNDKEIKQKWNVREFFPKK